MRWVPLLCALTLAAQTPAPTPAARPKPAASKSSVPPKVASTPRREGPKESPAPSWRDLRFPPLRPVEIPKVEVSTLPNGMKLYLLEDHELPIVNGVALVRAGNLFDPADKVGLATMTGMVMRTGGTREATGDQLDEQLEGVAASVESGIAETSATVSFSALKESADSVMSAFRDILAAPEFREEKVDLAKTQLRGSIARRNDEGDDIAAREFGGIVYGRDNSYGWSMEYEHIERISRADLVAFHKRYFFPPNTMLAIYGDFSTAEMKAKVEKLFATWTAVQPPVPPFPPVTAKPNPGLHLAARKDLTQTFFQIGHLGGQLKDKDYAALTVMSDILGGGFSSRLFKRVRTGLGYAYSVGASWDADFDHPGVFRISGSTKSLSTTQTFRAILEEIDRMQKSDVTDEELKTSRDSVLNSFVFNFDTKRETIGRLLNYDYFGYPKDFIFQYQKAVAAVTKADVRRVARDYLKPDQLVFVAAGNPSDFVEPPESLGLKVHKIDLTIPEPKVQTAKADAQSLARGKQLLARVQQALGGVDKIAAVRDWVESADFKFDPSAGGLQVQQVDRWVSPSHFRQELTLPFGKILSYCDGSSGWLNTPRGDGPLMGDQLKQAQGEIFRSFFWLFLGDRIAGRQVNAVDDTTLEISNADGLSVRISVDAKTGLPTGEVFGAGNMGRIEQRWENFQPSAGLQYPRKVTVFRDGKKFADVTIKDVQINTGATAEQISKRPLP